MQSRPNHTIAVAAFLAAWLVTIGVRAEPEARPTSFNVKDFGAKGDGKADDTQAIQAAFDAAGKKTWSEQYPGGVYFISVPVVPTAVVLDSCDIYALGNPKRRAAVFCEEVPNQIIVRSCRGLCDLPVVQVSEKIDLDTYFDNAEKRRACLRFVIGEENVEVFDANRDLPETMRPYQANRVVADASPKSGTWHRGAMVWNRNREGSWTPQGFLEATTPADREPLGWLCVETGKPGVWREVYGVLERATESTEKP